MKKSRGTAIKKILRWNSTLPASTKPIARKAKLQSGGSPTRSRKPIPKRNPQKLAKRMQRNRDYYQSAEWRAKRKLVFERDGHQCVEVWEIHDPPGVIPKHTYRCPNRGEVVNGKQTARGLVCEEVSYGHRGVPDRIDTCKTRCRECDRRLTPVERVNHRYGFRRGAGEGEA